VKVSINNFISNGLVDFFTTILTQNSFAGIFLPHVDPSYNGEEMA
jgi:hypothetical protein